MAKAGSTRFLAFEALRRVEQGGAFADIFLSHIADEADLPNRDRALLNELVRGVVRWKKKLDWIVDQLWQGEKSRLPDSVRWALWLGFYQILYLNKVPSFAAVSETTELVKRHIGHKWSGVANGILRTFLRNPERIRYPDVKVDPVAAIAISKSHPEWLVQRWIDRLGQEEAEKLCDANNTASPLYARMNPLKTSPFGFEALLHQDEMELQRSAVPGFYQIGGKVFNARQDLMNHGFLTIQDASAGLVGLLADPQPGQRILDLCAAPGGKATHLAELAKDDALIIAGDRSVSRIGLMKSSKNRLGLKSVKVIAADARNFPVSEANIVILDAPCSGLGVLSKKPDLRWRRESHNISELAALQGSLLQTAAMLVKKGGALIYSTCTMEPEENEDVIFAFLNKNHHFIPAPEIPVSIPKEVITPEGFIRTWPHKHQMDGSFAAKLIKMN